MSPLVAAVEKVTMSFRAVTSAARLESRYPQPWGIASGRINIPQRWGMGKFNSEIGKLKVNGKEPDKKKSKNNQCVETNRGFFL